MGKYIISIGNGFFIENKKEPLSSQGIDYNRETSLAEFETIDGKVHYIMNPFPLTDAALEECKGIELLKEEAKFEVKRLNDRKWELVEEFEGTLLDALEYIKDNFKNEE